MEYKLRKLSKKKSKIHTLSVEIVYGANYGYR